MFSDDFVLLDQATMLAYMLVHASYIFTKIARDATETAGDGDSGDGSIAI